MRPARFTLAAPLVCLLASGAAHSCGSWLPPERLQDRQAAVLSLSSGTFAFEAARLVAPDDVVPAAPVYLDPDAQLGGAAAAQVRALRALKEPRAADALSTPDLGSAERAYALGAVAWHAGDRSTAARHFVTVLAQPDATRSLRSITAAWMLSRIATSAERWAASDRWMTQVRALRLAGAPDPLGLYWSSLGEQARNALTRGQFERAVALYARQAANGERSGIESLLLVARRLASNQDQFEKAVAGPLVQRLLAIYFFSRGGEWLDAYPEHGIRESRADAEPAQVAQLLAAARAQGIRTLEGADRMAAVAYRSGRWDLASELVAVSGGAPLALWIGAKLKLRAGDRAGAEAALAAASRAFPPDEIWSDPVWYGGEYLPKPVCDIAADRGLLRLDQGDYGAAAERLLEAGDDYWTELAYVAERVLDLNQLEALVAAHPAPSREPEIYSQDRRNTQQRAVLRLRALAARRLLRAGRDAAAIPLFADANLRIQATRYAEARARARRVRDPADVASAWFSAARILRTHGDGLLGRDSWVDPEDAAWVSPGEHERRRKVSEPPPFDRQDAARYFALEHLDRAAALLPARSQAFAAVLCRATAWSIHFDPPLGRANYARYVREGAWVPWGAVFGRGPSDGSACPLPDFGKVKYEHQVATLRAAWRTLRPWLLPGLVLVVFLIWQLQRSTATTSRQSTRPSDR